MKIRYFRYLPAMAIWCMALSTPTPALAADKELAAQMRKLQAQVAELEQKLGRTQDFIALTNLEDAYGYYVDKGQWDQAADLFARDGRLEIAGRGVYVGRERVRAFLHHLPEFKYGQVFNHMQLQPVITVAPDGMTAQGRWRSLIQAGVLNKSAQWGEGVYENAYMKEDGVWKIKSLHFFVTYYVDFDKGWDKGGNAPPPPLKDLPADLPPTVEYKTYPDVFLPPYHYKNPVTGK